MTGRRYEEKKPLGRLPIGPDFICNELRCLEDQMLSVMPLCTRFSVCRQNISSSLGIKCI